MCVSSGDREPCDQGFHWRDLDRELEQYREPRTSQYWGNCTLLCVCSCVSVRVFEKRAQITHSILTSSHHHSGQLPLEEVSHAPRGPTRSEVELPQRVPCQEVSSTLQEETLRLVPLPHLTHDSIEERVVLIVTSSLQEGNIHRVEPAPPTSHIRHRPRPCGQSQG